MYSFIFIQGIFFTDIGRNASRCLHTDVRYGGGYNRFIRFVTFFLKKETELYNPTYGTAPLIIRFDFEFKILYYEICCTYALHMYRTNLYVSIFQSLINSDQFYREVNQWYGTGTVSYCTVRYVTW